MNDFLIKLPIPAILIDKSKNILYINASALKFLNFSLNFFPSKNIATLFPFLDLNNLNSNNETSFIYRDKSFKKHLLNVTVDYYDKINGNSVLYIMPSSEINVSKFSSLKIDYLKNRLMHFEKFVDNINEGVLVFNNNGDLLYSNQKANKKFKLSRTKINRYKVWHIIPHYSNPSDWQDLTIQLEEKERVNFIYKELDSSLSVEVCLHAIDNINYYMLIYCDISESTKDKLVIAEKSNQIDLFERNIPAVIFKLEVSANKGTYFTYVSDSFEKLFGFQLPINDPNWQTSLNIHPDDIIGFYNQMFESIEQFTKFNYTGRLLIEEKIIWCEVNAMPILIDGIFQFDGIILDITQKKEAEFEIKQKRAFNDSVLLNIPADVAVFDKDHRYLFLNMKGIANDELRRWLIGKTDFDYCEYRGLDTTMAEKRRVYFNKAKESKEQVDWIDTIKKGESTVYILRRFFPFYVDDVFVYMIGYGVDVTEMKLAQLHLSEAEKENELVLKSALDGVIMIDKDYKTTFWNPKAEAIFGWKSNQTIGKNMLSKILSHEIETNNDIAKFIEQNDSRNTQKRSEFLAKGKNGVEFPIELTIVYIDEVENKTHYCLFVRDISNKKAKELEVEIKNKALLKQNKSLEQFNYIASHDLQEPLISLIGYSNLLEEEYSDKLDEEGKLFLQFISKSATRMRSLIAGLLQYTRINTSENLSLTNIAIILQEVIENLNDKINLYKAEIKINELPSVYCCPLNISLLFQNLISNSIKFTKKDHRPSIEISCEERLEDWLFKIQDNGIGIPKKDLNDIFIMYRRLHNQDEYNGFGIGLAHCKRIVELHNGEIWVESTLGEGSIFYFTISKKI